MEREERLDDRSDGAGDPRRIIHNAAIVQFSERGFSATSMANIAEAAGMSRPALYQYFRNKGDIYASAFVALFNDHVDDSLKALDDGETTAQSLDGFLQRFEGDLWERMATSKHSAEIMDVRSADTAAEIHQVITRRRAALEAFLAKAAPGRSKAAVAQRAEWAEVLALSPRGLKSDMPTVEAYRRRLGSLARGVAADIDA